MVEFDEPADRIPVAWVINLCAACLSRQGLGPVGILLGYEIGGVKVTCFCLAICFAGFEGAEPSPFPFDVPPETTGLTLLP